MLCIDDIYFKFLFVYSACEQNMYVQVIKCLSDCTCTTEILHTLYISCGHLHGHWVNSFVLDRPQHCMTALALGGHLWSTPNDGSTLWSVIYMFPTTITTVHKKSGWQKYIDMHLVIFLALCCK